MSAIYPVGMSPRARTCERCGVTVLRDQGHACDPARKAGTYAIKCTDCRATIGQTDDLRTSAAGGRCTACRHAYCGTCGSAFSAGDARGEIVRAGAVLIVHPDTCMTEGDVLA